jgi:hypothetical protein
VAAAVIVGLQSLALLVAAGYFVLETLFGHPSTTGRALAGAGFALLAAVVLAFAARGVIGGSPAARTPVIVLEVLTLPVSYSLGFQAHKIWWGGPIMASAIAVILLLFTPSAREQLDRDI